jgi:hypothetical protein
MACFQDWSREQPNTIFPSRYNELLFLTPSPLSLREIMSCCPVLLLENYRSLNNFLDINLIKQHIEKNQTKHSNSLANPRFSSLYNLVKNLIIPCRLKITNHPFVKDK